MFAVIPILLISLIGLAVKLNNPKKYVITEVSKTGENTGICGTWSDIETRQFRFLSKYYLALGIEQQVCYM